jgi:hypothetical protein
MIKGMRQARRGRFSVPLALVLGLLGLLSACGKANQSGALPAPSNPPAEPAVRSTETPALVVPTTSTARRRAQDDVNQGVKKVKKAASFVMPRLAGHNLQAAQDQLQSLGSYLLHEEDASGQGRYTVLDRDWRVCSQLPEAGAKVLKTHIVVLRAVKQAETCPR